MTTEICDTCFEDFFNCTCNWPDDVYQDHEIEVDYDIQPAITLLNQKGYRTRYCCSGHCDDTFSNAYIAFDKPYQFKEMPEGWTYDSFRYKGIKKEYRHVIRPLNLTKRELNKMDELELYDYLEKVNRNLLTWAKGLDMCSSENILIVNPKTRYEKQMYKFKIKYDFCYFPPYICE